MSRRAAGRSCVQAPCRGGGGRAAGRGPARDSQPRPRSPRRAPGADASRRRRRTRHAAPVKAWFATVAKPISSWRSASSRCAMRSRAAARGRSPARRSSARASRSGAPAARPPLPPARRPAGRAPARGRCAAISSPRLVVEQVAEQPQRRALGLGAAERLSGKRRARRGARTAPGSPMHGRSSTSRPGTAAARAAAAPRRSR